MKYVIIILLISGHTGECEENGIVSLSLYEGENITMKCPIDAINCFWEKSNVLIYENQTMEYSDRRYRIVKSESNGGNSLEIINVTTSDSGLFKCIDNDDLNLYYQFILLVSKRPEIWIDNFGNGSLYCNTTRLESKDQVIKWEHQSVFNEKIRDFKGSSDGYLNLMENGYFQNHDRNGIFICTVENENGTLLGNASTKVEEFGKPVCMEKQGVNFDINGGGPVSLEISFYSAPEYDIVWMFDNRIIHNISDKYHWFEKKTNISTHIDNSPIQLEAYVTTLKIYKPTEDDLATYTVYINNTFGGCNCTVQFQDLPSVYNNTTTEAGKSIPVVALYILSCSGCIVVLVLIKCLYGLYTRYARGRPVYNVKRQDINTTREPGTETIQLSETYHRVADDTRHDNNTTCEDGPIQLSETYSRVADANLHDINTTQKSMTTQLSETYSMVDDVNLQTIDINQRDITTQLSAETYSRVADAYEETSIPFTNGTLFTSRSGRPFVFETQN